MKFLLGFASGAVIAAGAAILFDPSDCKAIKRKCKCAKKMIKNVF